MRPCPERFTVLKDMRPVKNWSNLKKTLIFMRQPSANSSSKTTELLTQALSSKRPKLDGRF